MATAILAMRPGDVYSSRRLQSSVHSHQKRFSHPDTPQKALQRSAGALLINIPVSPFKDPSSTTEADSDEDTHEEEVERIVVDHDVNGQPDFDDEEDELAYFQFLSNGALLERFTMKNGSEMRSHQLLDTMPPVKSAGVPEPVGPHSDPASGDASPQDDGGEAPPPADEQQQQPQEQPQEQAPSSGDSEGSSSPTRPPRGIPGQEGSSDDMAGLDEEDVPVQRRVVPEDAVAPVVAPEFGPEQQQADREGAMPRGVAEEPEQDVVWHAENPNRQEQPSSESSSGDSSDSSDTGSEHAEQNAVPFPEYYVDPDDEVPVERDSDDEPEEQTPPKNSGTSGTSDSSPDSESSGPSGQSSEDSQEPEEEPEDSEGAEDPVPDGPESPLGEEEDEEEAAELGQNQDSSPDAADDDANPLKRHHGEDDDESEDSKRPHMA